MKLTRRFVLASALAGIASLSVGTRLSRAADSDPSAAAQSQIERGLAYLKSQQQPDGGWQQANEPPAITAIAVKAFVQDPKFKADDPFLTKAFDKLLSYQKEDGSISDDNLATYNTAIALSALGESKQEKYKHAMEKALGYLRSI
ncbi:MAG TPA: prenyltransferase/squalene oxidase repeat-containing protein, partial [Tepidisphaeraceae bacterium]|nr:prenyltransferase/squalene oxidase repeat-containing protein [Tepidisphaeraceae bacterium]